MALVLMADRATPPTDAEIAALKGAGVQGLAGYLGGETAAESWAGSDFDRCFAQFAYVLPIYVGQNLPWTNDLTAERGQTDRQIAEQLHAANAAKAAVIALDIEYQTYHGDPAGTTAYVNGFGDAVVRVKGAKPGGSVAVPIDYEPIGANLGGKQWIADWTGVRPTSLTAPIVAQQFTDSFSVSAGGSTWDLSLIDSAALSGAPAPAEPLVLNGYPFYGGMLAHWRKNNGLITYGLPISAEFEAEDGKRRQWFERAVLEWIKGQWPAEYDVIGRLLATDVLSANRQSYFSDSVTYPDAFRKVKP